MILKCLQKNVKMLLKNKRFPSILLTRQKFILILIKKILMDKFRMKKNLMKKILMKQMKKYFYRIFFYIKVIKKYDQKLKEKLQNETRERYQNFLKNKQTKGKKRFETDIKIFLKEKEKNIVSIIVSVSKIFLRKKIKSKLSM